MKIGTQAIFKHGERDPSRIKFEFDFFVLFTSYATRVEKKFIDIGNSLYQSTKVLKKFIASSLGVYEGELGANVASSRGLKVGDEGE